MNQRENAKYRMYKSVLNFLTASLAAFTGFARLLTEITNFTDLNTTLDDLVQTQAKTIKGITEGKMSVLETLIKKTVNAARKALVFAKDQNDDSLAAIFDVTATSFLRLSESAALALIQNVYDALSNNSVALQAGYMITAADLTDISNGITTFKAQQSAPSNAASVRAAATKNIEDTMAKMDESLYVMDDLIVNTYAETNAELVDEYWKRRLN